MTHTDETINYAARAARGAALLDRVRPGWAREIDPATLDLGDCLRCVLGQLWDDFWAGRAALESADAPFSTVDHGFDARFGHGAHDFPSLAAACRTEIHKRMERFS